MKEYNYAIELFDTTGSICTLYFDAEGKDHFFEAYMAKDVLRYAIGELEWVIDLASVTRYFSKPIAMDIEVPKYEQRD